MCALTNFADCILKIVVNQAGCERVFSDFKVKQTQQYNQLGLPKLKKMTKVSYIHSIHNGFTEITSP